jgi:hypothetical protein
MDQTLRRIKSDEFGAMTHVEEIDEVAGLGFDPGYNSSCLPTYRAS